MSKGRSPQVRPTRQRHGFNLDVVLHRCSFGGARRYFAVDGQLRSGAEPGIRNLTENAGRPR
jgi:hypothetical protein